MEKEVIIFALLATAYVFLLESTLGSIDIWGAYYYRHAQSTLELGTTLYYDDLSYLGRNFTFPPAFFEFAASTSQLLGIHNFEFLRIPLHLLVITLFFFSTYLLFGNFKTKEQKILAYLIFISQTFIMMTATGITLHILSYLFLNISVILFSRKETIMKLLSALSLSLALSIHPTSLILFPFYVYAVGLFKMNKWLLLEITANCALAIMLSLPFYLPIFIRSGLPSEIVPTSWGYMLSFGLPNLFFDFQFSFPLLLASIGLGLLDKKLRLPALLLLFSFLFTALISYRANIFAIILLSCVSPQVFSKYLRGRTFLILLAAPIASLVVFPIIYSGTISWCAWGTSNKLCISPMLYLQNHAPSKTRVAINPIYGHLEAYYGGRPVLADLYVEYADYEKFKAENDFYERSNRSNLTKYNISFFMLDDMGVKRELADADRIYDNGFIHIFR
jgi:hypothetical protein